MNSNYIPYSYTNYSNKVQNQNDERLIGGGFLGPFILGGITGGLVSPYFNRPPVYYYQPGPYRPPYRPPYGPPFYGPRPY